MTCILLVLCTTLFWCWKSFLGSAKSWMVEGHCLEDLRSQLTMYWGSEPKNWGLAYGRHENNIPNLKSICCRFQFRDPRSSKTNSGCEAFQTVSSGTQNSVFVYIKMIEKKMDIVSAVLEIWRGSFLWGPPYISRYTAYQTLKFCQTITYIIAQRIREEKLDNVTAVLEIWGGLVIWDPPYNMWSRVLENFKISQKHLGYNIKKTSRKKFTLSQPFSRSRGVLVFGDPPLSSVRMDFRLLNFVNPFEI